MSKLTNALNQIWYLHEGKNVKIGLTRSFLDTLSECWHILPANHEKIKEKAPLMTVESNDSLISILSPFSGNVLYWEPKAANFPDRLTENDVIIELTTNEVEKKPTYYEEVEAIFGARRAAAARLNPMVEVRWEEDPVRHQQAIPEPPQVPRTIWNTEIFNQQVRPQDAQINDREQF